MQLLLPLKSLRDPAFSGDIPVMALADIAGELIAQGLDSEHAKFIVKACNSYHELLKSLKLARDFINEKEYKATAYIIDKTIKKAEGK